MDKVELLEKYSSNLAGSKNRNHYLSYARDFLDHADGLNKESVVKYMERLRRAKRSAGTINFAFRVVRRLFVVNGIEWPFSRGEAPQIGQRDEEKPGLKLEIVKGMIETAKIGNLNPLEAYCLALSTTYGLRRGEICLLTKTDVNLKSELIFIPTLKGGNQRFHLIPHEIKAYLAEYDFERQHSETKISQVFWQIVNKSGMEQLKVHKLGWHAIRRTLLHTLYDAGLNPQAIHFFMNWKGAEPSYAMDTRYYATSLIGLDGSEAIGREAESDKEIFAKHPLLEFWR